MSRRRVASSAADRVARRRRGLQRHELGHVPLDPHLAGHEGLHAGLGVPVDQDRLGRVVVHGDLEVLRLEVTGVEDHLAARGVHVGEDVLVGEGDRGHDQVHADGVGDRWGLALELGADGARLVEPSVAEERVRRHVGVLLTCSLRSRWDLVRPAPEPGGRRNPTLPAGRLPTRDASHHARCRGIFGDRRRPRRVGPPRLHRQPPIHARPGAGDGRRGVHGRAAAAARARDGRVRHGADALAAMV